MSEILVAAARRLGFALARARNDRDPPVEPTQAPTGGQGLDGDEWVKALPYERTLEQTA